MICGPYSRCLNARETEDTLTLRILASSLQFRLALVRSSNNARSNIAARDLRRLVFLATFPLVDGLRRSPGTALRGLTCDGAIISHRGKCTCCLKTVGFEPSG